MRERGFEPDFPAAALTQARQLSDPSAQPVSRRDLRGLLWCSIDNEDSRDLDQLSVAEAREHGIGILVAIADVDALVDRHSPIDQHAATNTTTVYTAAEIFAMLPERLSTDLSSLAEHEDRAAIVVDMTVAGDGTVASATLYPAMVRNRAKLAYPSVGAWLEGRGPEPAPLASVAGLAQNLRLQSDAAAALKASRHRRGALTLDTVEGRPVLPHNFHSCAMAWSSTPRSNGTDATTVAGAGQHTRRYSS